MAKELLSCVLERTRGNQPTASAFGKPSCGSKKIAQDKRKKKRKKEREKKSFWRAGERDRCKLFTPRDSPNRTVLFLFDRSPHSQISSVCKKLRPSGDTSNLRRKG